MIAAFCLGAAYAAALWWAAGLVAKQRKLPLGQWPFATFALCGVCAAAMVALFKADVAALLGTTMIGTIVCATVDHRTGLIFDVLSASMAAVATVLALWTGHFVEGVEAAGIVGGVLFGLYIATKRRGIGLGDVKLSAAMALGYGVQLSVVAIGSAFIIGAAWAAVAIGLGRLKRTDAVRFGPFIACGAFAGLSANVLGYRW